MRCLNRALIALTVSCGILAATPALTQTADLMVMPETIKWNPIPMSPGAEASYLMSDGAKPEAYVLRVRIKQDAKIPPHSHPDARVITVISGEIFAGRGEKIDPAGATVVPAGGLFTMPAGVVHWVQGKSDAMYQETGTGPTGTKFAIQ